jgi:hypothetical protein
MGTAKKAPLPLPLWQGGGGKGNAVWGAYPSLQPPPTRGGGEPYFCRYFIFPPNSRL